ncbi:MAG: hypothetical protein MJ033_04325 [Victivallaceae bacterium]|nr:hypothetical protein [Victivallaceae bacterium]
MFHLQVFIEENSLRVVICRGKADAGQAAVGHPRGCACKYNQFKYLPIAGDFLRERGVNLCHKQVKNRRFFRDGVENVRKSSGAKQWGISECFARLHRLCRLRRGSLPLRVRLASLRLAKAKKNPAKIAGFFEDWWA